MKRLLMGVMMMGLAALPVMAEDVKRATDPVRSGEEEAPVLPKDRAALLAERNNLIREATASNLKIRSIQDRAMKNDKDLRRLTAEVARLQEEIATKLHELHPELSDLENRRDAAMVTYEHVQTALRELKESEAGTPAEQ